MKLRSLVLVFLFLFLFISPSFSTSREKAWPGNGENAPKGRNSSLRASDLNLSSDQMNSIRAHSEVFLP